jgi:signal transduction histidine kinase
MLAPFTSDPRRRARIITYKIIAVGVVIIAAMWVMAGASIMAAREAAMDRTRSEGRNLAVVFAGQIDEILGDVAGAMAIIAQRIRAGRGHFDIHDLAREIPLLSSAKIQAAIIGPDGKLLSTTLDPAPQSIDLSDGEHIRVHLDGYFPGIFIGKPVIDRVSGKTTINVTRRVDADDGSFLGIIMFALAPANLTALPARIELGVRGTLTLVGLDHVIRARFTSEHPDGLSSIGKTLPSALVPSNVPANGAGSFVTASAIDNVARFFSYRRLTDYPLLVFVGLDLDEALAASRIHAMIIAAMAGLATVLLAGLAGFLIRQIGRSTAQEIALAEERSRLQADIALRQEVEQQLRAVQQTLRDAVDNISEGFVIYDRDDCFVMCNDPHRRLYPESARLMVPGTRFEEIVWASLDAGWYADAVGCEPEWLADRMHAHDHPSAPIEQRLADGRCVMVCERRMQNGGSAELHIDITKQKTNEDQLRHSRDNLNSAQRRAKIGSFERDLRAGDVFWSDEMYRIFERDPSTAPPTREQLLEIIHPEDCASFEASMAASERGLPTPSLQFRIRCPDGSLKWIYVEVELMLDIDGTAIRRVGTIRDVTETRAAEERQSQLERQLFQSQKLEALGTLAGGIAHDLNNTLMPILALSELLMRKMREGSGEREDLETIVQASRHGRDLVRRILAFSRHQQVARARVDLAAVTREALLMLRPTIPATVLINEEIEEVPLILADPGQIQQVVVNLVTNAVQAIGDGMGTITVSLSAAIGSRSPTGNFIKLRVIDTGCGMDAETKNRIFEPFFTTKIVGEGTGLGLSVVHGIVTNHGGSIEVGSEPGKGTEFAIFLPVLGPVATSVEAAAA